MSKDTGGPAFPVQDAASWQAHGMTLRDYFAVHASDGDIKAIYRARQYSHKWESDTWRQVARYMHADAMLAERAKQ